VGVDQKGEPGGHQELSLLRTPESIDWKEEEKHSSMERLFPCIRGAKSSKKGLPDGWERFYGKEAETEGKE